MCESFRGEQGKVFPGGDKRIDNECSKKCLIFFNEINLFCISSSPWNKPV